MADNLERNKHVRSAVIFWFMTIGYMALIFFLSSLQGFDMYGLPEDSDKVVHTLIYAPLAFLLYLSLNKSGLKKSLFMTAFLIAGIYGITDEVHQYYVPGRYSSAGDVTADFFGAFLGSMSARHYVRKKNHNVAKKDKGS